MLNISDRLKELKRKVQSDDLQKGRGLGGEVNYYIFDYDPADEYEVMDYIGKLASDNDQIVIINIHDVITDILKSKNYLDKVYDLESKKSTQHAATAIMRALSVENKDGLLRQEIRNRIPEGKTIFLTGIGESYRIIRAHTLLANLQVTVTENPVILFYPGKYDGQSLKLFGKFPATNYYRADKLVER
ncbi:MAG: DUF1788 domain-containing protein [Candidatus Saccharibacteria bacterium]|nr:DUF1788 domain-containing protein [Candidatus Saccharibacteria bacterium]